MKTEKDDPVKINVAIVDDEKHCIDLLRDHLSGDDSVRIVAEINDPSKAVKKILSVKPNLVFLDIQMPESSGFDILRSLRQSGFEPYVIFVTAHDRYAIDAIRNAAFDYLLKPVDREELKKCLERFSASYSKEQRSAKYISLLETLDPKNKIKLGSTGGFVIVHMDDIIHVQADWNYSKVFTGPDHFETVTMNIGSVEKLLPAQMFVRINRSTIINLNYLTRVRRLTRKCILVKDGQEYEFNIPINRIRELERRI